MDSHQGPPRDLDFKTALHEEHHLLEQVEVPILTVSATNRRQLKEHFHESFPAGEEVVFSRAHYSMALGAVIAALEADKTTWLVDPTNYVTRDDWNKIFFTHTVGKLIARHPLLKEAKDLIDTRARNKLPLTDAIKEPLEYLIEKVHRPLLSFHYEAGNVAVAKGHPIVQVVTDPHVRPQYLTPLPDKSSGEKNKLVTYCVFDEATKTDLLLRAEALNKEIDPADVIVTGPPVDPRIVDAHLGKTTKHLSKRPLRLAVTTGGLGQNIDEVKIILDQLSRFCFTESKSCASLFLYAGTHKDFHALYREFAAVNKLPVSDLSDPDAKLRILYSSSLVEANELMIEYMFPWADGIICKPSGDMAYDAAAAGCFTLFMEPWGEWEQNILERFKHLGIGVRLDSDHLEAELTKFSQHFWEGQSWFAQAIDKTLALPPLFREGTHNILKTYLERSHTK